MKHRLTHFIMMALLCPSMALADWSSIAINYAHTPPVQALTPYDLVVIDPQSTASPSDFRPAQTVLAYVSLGETANTATYRSQLAPAWILGSNPLWHSVVMNAADPAWRSFFINQVITPLWKQGYRGFFLDTVDAFQAVTHTPDAKAAQIQGLIRMIRDIHAQYPEAILILNRGFELLPTVAPYIKAVAAESLYQGWNQKTQRYQAVSTQDAHYLLQALNRVKALGLKAIVIDYVSPNDPALAKQLRDRIQAQGMIPYISDGLLQTTGISDSHPIQRKLMMIYTKNARDTLFNPDAFVLLAQPLEYLGYQPHFFDANAPLPTQISQNDVAGIVVLTNALQSKQDEALYQFLRRAKAAGVKIVFFTNFGFKPTRDRLKSFGITLPTNTGSGLPHLNITFIDKTMVGDEVQPHVNQYDYDLYQAANARVLLKLEDKQGQVEDAIALTPWGGYALDPYVATSTPEGISAWVINPLLFLPQALSLDTFPIPDVTTENGRRLAFIHIDGDGFASKVGWQNNAIAASVLLEKILKKYALPTTFSVVTADLMPQGLYPNHTDEFSAVARACFALPWVEAASHTFSHPFDWIKILTESKNGVYNLPVTHYQFNETAEISGSLQYINTHLLPKGKQSKLLLWSGHANANEQAFKLLHDANLLNMNGGNTEITDAFPYLSLISPMGLWIGPYYQVFAPIGNEEYYTNNWTKPLYGFKRVIQTFEHTEKPHRFKPVDIYYHIYSATTEASLSALETVYQWAMQQPLHWITASDYVNKVNAANDAVILKNEDGWTVLTNGLVRELRLPLTNTYPDLERSRNVIGYNTVNNDLYIHLGDDHTTTLFFTPKPSDLPYLASANGGVISFQRSKNQIQFHLMGSLPLNFTLHQKASCLLKTKGHWINTTIQASNHTDDTATYQLKETDSDELILTC